MHSPGRPTVGRREHRQRFWEGIARGLSSEQAAVADYVLRDGYHAGVPNSQYDLERILQLIFFDADGPLFDHRAQIAIEGYFIARYHLYLQLYYHRTVRAAEVMLRSTLLRAKTLRLGGDSLGDINPGVVGLFGDAPLSSAVRLTDHDLWSAFRSWSIDHPDTILRDLSARLLQRRLFKVREIGSDDLPNFYEKQLPQIVEAAETAKLDAKYYVKTDTASDTPYKIADVSGPDRAITSVRMSEAQDSIASLEILSPIIQTLQNEAYQKVRVCFPVEIRAAVGKIMN
jgi:HD superfamily phosphohydrolase